MKSNQSYFDKTVFRKNLTRFAPAWGLYTLCLVLTLVLMLNDGINWLPSDMVDSIQILCLVTPCYAFLVAQLLFGDLYNSRMCNALHALPLRREGWFLTNVVSGLVFHLIPTVIMAVLAAVFLLMSGYASGWLSAPWWLLGVNLQYLCFFGIAVLSVFCVGSRFAMAVVYGILNFGSLIPGWIVHTLYTPMFYGIRTDLEPFFLFSPVAQMMDDPFLSANRLSGRYSFTFQTENNFWYYFICAAVGLMLIVLALQLYRKRKLECAGDFMAIRHMEPVFLVIYTLVVGSVFQLIFDDIFGMGSLLFMFIGLAVGYFTGQMLLQRSVRVFQGKAFLGCGAVMAAFALTLGIAALDPFGIESWIPKAEEVNYVTVASDHYTYLKNSVILDTTEDIETILSLHRETLEEHTGSDITIAPITEPVATAVAVDTAEAEEATYEEINAAFDVTFEYHLTSGKVVSRYYTFWSGDPSGQILRQYFSSPEAVFGLDTDVNGLILTYGNATFEPYPGDTMRFAGEDLRGLYEAILADCKAGTMAQNWAFHQADDHLGWLYLEDGLELMIYTGSENTVAFLESKGLDVQATLSQRYG